MANAGLGGVFSGAAEIGDGVIVGEETMAPKDSKPANLSPCRPGERVVHHARSDIMIVECCARVGFVVSSGATVSGVTATGETASRLAGRVRASLNRWRALRCCARS